MGTLSGERRDTGGAICVAGDLARGRPGQR